MILRNFCGIDRSTDLDLDLLIHHLRVVREILENEPMKSQVVAELQPGPNYPDDQLGGA
jgi:hypothetical protein